ncbi:MULTISPECIES: MFS transporter [unclassified Solwaraspora]|uniref:MFS transporter n=1 Tax=unclassified Solwaraspora TaxID=2627926 RepID=UPI00248CB852|nr:MULTISPECIES: MFS transporter [unclassified Solwaraspora]WBB96675.1 MFS transporter [Solwaraspora sp. WMMA2059]WBC19421.1 MFS transporter [Solwaraspora sp. WMMA2080]WJK32996.1 MFS transporter [Solwaraspora sp. WMMA2065]
MNGRSGTGLWHDRQFLRFWAGEATSQVGAQVTQLALPLTAVLALQASASEVGLLNAASYAPFLLVTLLVGVWVDRVRRKPLMIYANVGRAALVTLVPVLAALGQLRIEFLYAIAVLVGTLTVVFDVAYQSYLPTLVRREHLVEGNSKLQGTSSLAQIGGPGLSGLLVQVATAPVALLINGMSYLVSVATLVAVRRPEPPPRRHHAPVPLRRSVAEGIQLILRSPILRACALQSGLYNLFLMSLQTLFVLYAARVLGFGAGGIGALLSVGAVGSLLGSLVARRLTATVGLGRSILTSTVLCCVAPMLIPLAPGATPLGITMIVGGFAIAGAGATMANIQIISLRQAITAERLLGRMNAGYRLISWGTLPVGGALGGWLGDLIGLRPALYLTAIGFLSAVVVIATSPVRRLVDFPARDRPTSEFATVD